jgi:hypothetical protein
MAEGVIDRSWCGYGLGLCCLDFARDRINDPPGALLKHWGSGTILDGCCCSIINEGERTMATETRETGSLIGSDKVEGTAVYGADDTKIGSIERVMIDKMSGKVSYAVLSFGGFLGIGDDHYPLPWQSLKYDTNLGGYRTGITEKQLQGAPKYGNDNAWNWSDPARTRSVNDYYGVAS